MIRDFWGVSKRTLKDDIDALKDKVHPMTWDAIDAVRSAGDIGAHMETDVNLIIDVDASEAEQLIKLVETLLTDWYVVRHERQLQMDEIVMLAEAKDAERKKSRLAGEVRPEGKL